MFGKLRDKFSGWLKKEKVEEVKKELGKVEEKPKKIVKKVERKIEPSVEKKEQLAEVPVVSEEPEKVEARDSGFFGKLKKKLVESELSSSDFDEVFEDLEMTLLENNVSLAVVEKIHDSLANDLVGTSVPKKNIEKLILDSLKNAVLDVLVEGENVVSKIKESKEPFVILFCGINGSGKTTTVAKFASMLKSSGIGCVLGAGDTFRAASIEQLEKHASAIGVPIVKSDYGADPASVAFDAVKYAKAHKLKAVLIDTAGRMYTQGNLMREMEKIVRVAKPDLKIFVGESITGNDAVSQAKAFDDSVGIDGIILSKADVDEKAGTILSVGFVTGKPILYLGVGQEYSDLKRFEKVDVLKNLGLA